MFPTFIIAGGVSAELFINGGAELGDMTGWVQTAGSHCALTYDPIDGHGDPIDGDYFFYCCPPNVATVKSYNRMAVASFISTAVVDAGNARITVDWWGGTYAQGTNDQPQLNLFFRDGALGLLSTYNSGYKNPLTVYPQSPQLLWDPYQELLVVIPALTRFIDVEMESKRNTGSNNDARFDGIEVTVSSI